MKMSYSVSSEFVNSVQLPIIQEVETVNQVKKSDKKNLNISFYQSPNKVEKKSAIIKLKEKFGIEIDNIKTFKTPLISFNPVYYNENYYFLSIESDLINLNIVKDNASEIICSWDFESLLKSFKKKNLYSNIQKDEIENLIFNSELCVKFNVSKIKDHGTFWKFVDKKSNKNNSEN